MRSLISLLLESIILLRRFLGWNRVQRVLGSFTRQQHKCSHAPSCDVNVVLHEDDLTHWRAETLSRLVLIHVHVVRINDDISSHVLVSCSLTNEHLVRCSAHLDLELAELESACAHTHIHTHCIYKHSIFMDAGFLFCILLNSLQKTYK